MADNMIINGIFDNQQLDPWFQNLDADWLPVFIERSASNWALAIPNGQTGANIQQRIAALDSISGLATVPIEARAEKSESLLMCLLSGVNEDGFGQSYLDICVVGNEWSKPKFVFSQMRILYRPTIQISAFPIEWLKETKGQQKEPVTYIDNIELYVSSSGSEEDHS